MSQRTGVSSHSLHTENYIWFTKDVLGQGATGSVFKGHNRRTGELVAVKYFNPVSYQRPSKVQDREFEVMAKLNHPNIVRLMTTEIELTTHGRTIIMELCQGGSLFDVLDHPKNYSGMDEEDFLQVMKDVTSGLKYLHTQNFVHRDIKPGNIMRHVSDDGRYTYKLTDFGAARQLAEDGVFTSMYGTEEYLHPDMYERAVLGEGVSGREFNASVDLWSVGVTLYHVATGRLPFRPRGGRSNRRSMFDILSKKPSRAISGVESPETPGHVEYSYSLPENSQLSQGLQEYLIPILSGILEYDEGKQMTFERFFVLVESLFRMKVVHVYHLEHGLLHHVYLDPDASMFALQRKLADLTKVPAGQLKLYYENHQLKIDDSCNLPNTTAESPVLSRGGEWHVGDDLKIVALLHSRKLQKFEANSSFEEDAKLARIAVAALHNAMRGARQLQVSCDNIKQSVAMLSSIINEEHRTLIVEQRHSIEISEQLRVQWNLLRKSLSSTVSIVQSIMQANEMDGSPQCLSLKDEANELNRQAGQLGNKVLHLDGQIKQFEAPSWLTNQWSSAPNVDRFEHCAQRVASLQTTAEEIRKQFTLDKRRHSSYNDDLIHRFEKLRLIRTFEDGYKMVREFQQARGDLQYSLQAWMSSCEQYRLRLREFSDGVHQNAKLVEDFERSVIEFQQRHKDTLDSLMKHNIQIVAGNTAEVKRLMALSTVQCDYATREQLMQLSQWLDRVQQNLHLVKEEASAQEELMRAFNVERTSYG